MQHIAFIGLGNMGAPMARNLVAAGFHVSVFDLAPAAVAAIVPSMLPPAPPRKPPLRAGWACGAEPVGPFCW